MANKKEINKEQIRFDHNMKLLKIIFFLLVLLGIFVAIGYNFNKTDKNQILEKQTCITDTDCVAAACCHPSACVPITEKPDCSEIFCTQECKPGTLDCNQGYCSCINGKCQAVFD